MPSHKRTRVLKNRKRKQNRVKKRTRRVPKERTYQTIHRDYDEKRMGFYPDVIDTDNGPIEINVPYRIKPVELSHCELWAIQDIWPNGKPCYKLISVAGNAFTDTNSPRFKHLIGAIGYAKRNLGRSPIVKHLVLSS